MSNHTFNETLNVQSRAECNFNDVHDSEFSLCVCLPSAAFTQDTVLFLGKNPPHTTLFILYSLHKCCLRTSWKKRPPTMFKRGKSDHFPKTKSSKFACLIELNWAEAACIVLKGSVVPQKKQKMCVSKKQRYRKQTGSGLVRYRLEVTTNTLCYSDNTHMILLAACCVLKFTSEFVRDKKKSVDILVSWCCLCLCPNNEVYILLLLQPKTWSEPWGACWDEIKHSVVTCRWWTNCSDNVLHIKINMSVDPYSHC